MHTKLTLCALGVYLVAGTLAASTARHSWFEAHTASAKELTLRGLAEFGRVPGAEGPEAFVLTLGAESPTGAVVFTGLPGARPEPGVYPIGSDRDEGMRVLVVTGSPTHPTGAYWARGGTLTITRSGSGVLEGRFDLDAVGFEATNPAAEDRELVVRGAFMAFPGTTVASPK
jgi:hypothetical protein